MTAGRCLSASAPLTGSRSTRQISPRRIRYSRRFWLDPTSRCRHCSPTSPTHLGMRRRVLKLVAGVLPCGAQRNGMRFRLVRRRHLRNRRHCRDCRYALVVGSHHDDREMRARWVGAHVAETAIRIDQQPPLADGRAQHRFLEHGVDVVGAGSEDAGDRARDVLVKLDLQRSPVRGRTHGRGRRVRSLHVGKVTGRTGIAAPPLWGPLLFPAEHPCL